MNKAWKTRGFTLIELLIAITVLALVATLGWRGLDGIMHAREQLTTNLDETRGMQLSFAQMQSDCANVAPLTLIGSRPQMTADSERIRLVRTVYADGQPTRLTVVVYRLDNGVLTRRESAATRDLHELDGLWQATADDGGGTLQDSQAVVLQNGLNEMATRTWIGAGPWQAGATAPSNIVAQGQVGNPNALKGLEVSLKGKSGSTMLKVFLIGAA